MHFKWRVSCLSHVVLRTCPAICKSGGTPPCPVVPDPLSGARPLGFGVGSGYLRTEVPQFGPGTKPWYGVWCPPFPAICKNGITCPRALWGQQHCEWHANGESCWCHWRLSVFHLDRLDSTRSTCRAHAFWLCRASRTAQLDSLDTTSSTGSTRRDLVLSYDHRNLFIV